MHRPWVRLLTAGGAGVLGAAIVLALSYFFDIGIKSTPVYQARVGLQPHRSIQLTYAAPTAMNSSMASLEFVVDKLTGVTSIGDSTANPKVSNIAEGTKLVITGPQNQTFTAVATRGGSSIGTFSFPANYDDFVSENHVMVPIVSEPKSLDGKTVTYVTVTMRFYTGRFTIIEG